MSKTLASLILGLACTFAPTLTLAQNKSVRDTPLIVGVGTHFAQNKTDQVLFDSADKDGTFESIRDEVYWGDIEKTKGEFLLEGKALSSITRLKQFAKSNRKPVVVLSYGNKYYDAGGQPYSQEARDAFARYALFIAKQFGNDKVYFEVWNEWNIGSGTRPPRRTGSPLDYVKLVDATARAIKSYKPDATVLAGALGDDLDGWPWLTAALDGGLLKLCDGISVHLYNYSAPIDKGGDNEFVARLNTLSKILRKANSGKPFPIFITEIGWPGHNGKGSVPMDLAASLISRTIVKLMQFNEVTGVWIYELFDGGQDKSEREQNFGLLTSNGTEKPVMCAFRKTMSILKDSFPIDSKIVGDISVYRFRQNIGSGQDIFVAMRQMAFESSSPAKTYITEPSVGLDCPSAEQASASKQAVNFSPRFITLKKMTRPSFYVR